MLDVPHRRTEVGFTGKSLALVASIFHPFKVLILVTLGCWDGIIQSVHPVSRKQRIVREVINNQRVKRGFNNVAEVLWFVDREDRDQIFGPASFENSKFY